MLLWLSLLASPAVAADVGELPEISAPFPVSGSSAREDGKALRNGYKGTASIQSGNAMAILGPVLIAAAGAAVISSVRRNGGGNVYVAAPLAATGVVFMAIGVPLSLEGNRQYLRERGRPSGRPDTGALIGTVFGLSLASLALSPVVQRRSSELLISSGLLYVGATVATVAWSEDNRRRFNARPAVWYDPAQQQGGLAIRGRW